MSDFDALVIGAGAVGLACGYALSKRGKSVLVLEREVQLGTGVSARNSEVIHAGLHYPTDSLKARLCVAGRRALYNFLQSHGVAFKKCGKLIVATSDTELRALDGLRAQGEINGVEALRWLDGESARALEPGLQVVAAIESRESGIFDAHGYMLALEGEISAKAGVVALNAPFQGARLNGSTFAAHVGGDAPMQVSADTLVVAAGLSAQACARIIDCYPKERIPAQHLAKGNYFTLQGVRAPFERLIYPPPIPGALGTHYRRDLGGVARFGPDLEWVEREDYSVSTERVASFYETVRKFWPALPNGALVPDYAGIRPKIHGPDEAQADFVIDCPRSHGVDGLVCLFGIESPGLTSSLAIGEEVAQRLT